MTGDDEALRRRPSGMAGSEVASEESFLDVGFQGWDFCDRGDRRAIEGLIRWDGAVPFEWERWNISADRDGERLEPDGARGLILRWYFVGVPSVA
jgi:hypothetical protein